MHVCDAEDPWFEPVNSVRTGKEVILASTPMPVTHTMYKAGVHSMTSSVVHRICHSSTYVGFVLFREVSVHLSVGNAKLESGEMDLSVILKCFTCNLQCQFSVGIL